MDQRLAVLTVELEKLLAELDAQQLHHPAIYVARAIEALKLAGEEDEPAGLSVSTVSAPTTGAALN